MATMLAVTPELKEHMVKTKGLDLAANASDDAARDLASKALADGRLSIDAFKDLTKSATNPANQTGAAIRNVIREEITKALGVAATGASVAATGRPGLVDQVLDTRSFAISDRGANPGESTENSAAGSNGTSPVDRPSGAKAYGLAGVANGQGDGGPSGAAANGRIDPVHPLKGYDTTRKGAYYSESRVPWVKAAFGDRPVMSGQHSGHMDAVAPRELNHPSEADKAVSGAWFKFSANLALRDAGLPIPSHYRLTDKDKQIVEYAMHELPFSGVIGWNEQQDTCKSVLVDRKMTDLEIKAVLDDSLSGGVNAAPIAFDDAVIITPLLNGELFPLVNLVNVTRGRRINGFSMANPVFTWGVASGSTIPLFNTDSFLAAFNTNIFASVGAMELSLDFESDSPVAVGDIVIQRYGQAALTTLDYVVALGDGITQPLGVLNTAGVSTVTPDNTTTGPPSVSDYLSLLFGITKAFRNEADRQRLVFMSNDTTYRRSRNIKVDPQSSSTDQRLIMGMNVEDYYTFGHPHKIQNDIPNSSCAAVNLARYRMYRRLGLQVRVEAGGKELALGNKRMIVVRMRLGGQMELSGAMTKWTTGQN